MDPSIGAGGLGAYGSWCLELKVLVLALRSDDPRVGGGTGAGGGSRSKLKGNGRAHPARAVHAAAVEEGAVRVQGEPARAAARVAVVRREQPKVRAGTQE